MSILITKEEKIAFEKNLMQDLWRTHSDSINKALLLRWWPIDGVKHLLKTDLFDEAINEGLYPLLAARVNNIIGMDISFQISYQARLRYPSFQTIGANVRCLPFMDNTFDLIVSNSTLDHFKSIEETIVSLRELHRVLRPKGQLLLTLDNLANPLIALRNVLPFPWLNRLGILPYYVGATCGPRGLRVMLRQVGFRLFRMDTVMHCPRVLAVAAAHWMQKHTGPKSQRHFLRFLQAFECLSRLPTRFFTGHFVAVHAIKSLN